MNPPNPAASPLIPILILVTLGYLGTCVAWPFATCRKCHGSGLRGPNRRMRRYCRRCDNTGLRLRIGRRLWNLIRRH